MKEILKSIALKLKQHPDATIDIIGYPITHAENKVGYKRVKIIKAYLVETEGIAPLRLNTIWEEVGNVNIIDFILH